MSAPAHTVFIVADPFTACRALQDEAYIVQAKVVGRVTMQQLLCNEPCPTALVQPIHDEVRALSLAKIVPVGCR